MQTCRSRSVTHLNVDFPAEGAACIGANPNPEPLLVLLKDSSHP